MARGVRKPKAKLAGGIELFSVSDISFIRGRGEIGTLISARLDVHYGRIVQDIDRVQTGYELIKLIDKVTEDEPEDEYFYLMEQALKALDDAGISLDLIRAWFNANLLKLAGHAPNLETTAAGDKLSEGKDTYSTSTTWRSNPNPRRILAPATSSSCACCFRRMRHRPYRRCRMPRAGYCDPIDEPDAAGLCASTRALSSLPSVYVITYAMTPA